MPCIVQPQFGEVLPKGSPCFLLEGVAEGGTAAMEPLAKRFGFLSQGFAQALELVRSCGFTRVATLTAKGREYIEL